MTAQLQSSLEVDQETFDVMGPATHIVVGTFPVHSPTQVAEAVAQAREAQVWWAAQGFSGRRSALVRWIRWLARNSDELFELGHAEGGKPRGDTQFELVAGIEDIRWGAAHAKRILGQKRVAPGIALANFDARIGYEPLGVVGVITPWNASVYLVLTGLAHALAAGNAVVLKPSELSAATGVWCVESFARANPDAPKGLAGWVTGFGDTGAALCHSGVNKLAFTGSVSTGRRVMSACAESLTPVILELGGKDACIVAADADLDAAAGSVVWGSMWNAGQTCIGIERVYVVDSVREAFLAKVKERVSDVTVGLDSTSSYGPMMFPNQIDVVRRHVTDALDRGATALVGGLGSIKAPYIEPIVLVDVPEDALAVREETFGPVVVINSVSDVDDAVAKANGTPFGLGSSVFSKRSGPAIARRLRAGGVTINTVLTFVGMPNAPFGGVGDSGFGRFHGADGLREFSRAKTTARKRFPLGPEMQIFPRTQTQFETVNKMVKARYGRQFR